MILTDKQIWLDKKTAKRILTADQYLAWFNYHSIKYFEKMIKENPEGSVLHTYYLNSIAKLEHTGEFNVQEDVISLADQKKEASLFEIPLISPPPKKRGRPSKGTIKE